MDEVFPLKRDDELIRESDQVFIFDLLSYLVFGEENAQGLTFKPHAQTRSVITVTQCWDVYTGPKDQLEYSYTNCVSHSYWVDDALINNSNWNSEGGGSGDVWIGGGSSGGSGSSSGTPAGNIFKKEADQDSLLWVITENMTARIMEDCLGGDLYSQLKEKVKNNKINLEFDFGKGIPTIGKSIPCTSDWKNWKQTTFCMKCSMFSKPHKSLYHRSKVL